MGESPSDQDVDDEDQTVDDVHGMTEFMSDRQRRRVGVPGTTRGLTAE